MTVPGTPQTCAICQWCRTHWQASQPQPLHPCSHCGHGGWLHLRPWPVGGCSPGSCPERQWSFGAAYLPLRLARGKFVGCSLAWRCRPRSKPQAFLLGERKLVGEAGSSWDWPGWSPCFLQNKQAVHCEKDAPRMRCWRSQRLHGHFLCSAKALGGPQFLLPL